jgi:hypothetical protein
MASFKKKSNQKEKGSFLVTEKESPIKIVRIRKEKKNNILVSFG